MPFLFDGYNIYHAAAKIAEEWSHITPRSLCKLIEADLFLLGDMGTIVFDGTMARGQDWGAEPLGGLRVVYSGPDSDADTVLEKLIKDNTAPRRLIVVSSDHRLRTAAHKRKAISLTAQEYLLGLIQRLETPPPAPPREPPEKRAGLTDAETREWMEFFGYDPDEPPDETSRAR